MKKNMTFEEAMQRLETVVDMLAAPETELEQSLKLFAESTELIAFCEKKLRDARLQVEKLSSAEEQDEMEGSK